MSTLPIKTAAAYEALRGAVQIGRLGPAQASALLVVLNHLSTAAGLLATAESVLPQYADRPDLMWAYRSGVSETVVAAFTRELTTLAEAPPDRSKR